MKISKTKGTARHKTFQFSEKAYFYENLLYTKEEIFESFVDMSINLILYEES